MSQLTNNTASLQEAIELLRTKATTGGGSGSTTTATVSLTSRYTNYVVYYVGTSGVITATHGNSPFTCVVPSILCLKNGGTLSTVSGGVTELINYNGFSVYSITGDGSILLYDMGGGSSD